MNYIVDGLSNTMYFESNEDGSTNFQNLNAIILKKVVEKSEIPDDVISLIENQKTATKLTQILGFEVKVNRINVQLKSEDVIFVATPVDGNIEYVFTKEIRRGYCTCSYPCDCHHCLQMSNLYGHF